MYDSTFINKDNIIKNVFPSRSYGGYSLVWGATINGERENDIIDSQFNFKPNFYALKNDLKVHENPHSLAVNQKLCNFCGECLKGCSKNAIWDSREVFNELIDSKAIKYRRDKVVKLCQKEGVEFKTLIYKWVDEDHIELGSVDPRKIFWERPSGAIGNRVTKFDNLEMVHLPKFRFK